MLTEAEIAAFRVVADKMALQELVTQYSRAVDRGDFALLRDLYHHDAVEEHGDLYDGPAGKYIDWLEETLSGRPTMVHYVVNTLFEVRGDYAEGEVHKISYHRSQPPEPTETISGSRSHDLYEKRDGVWRFAKRSVTLDWIQIRPAAMEAYEQYAAGSPHGAPDETDLSYRRLKLFTRGVALSSK